MLTSDGKVIAVEQSRNFVIDIGNVDYTPLSLIQYVMLRVPFQPYTPTLYVVIRSIAVGIPHVVV